jgi:hypothetical protein
MDDHHFGYITKLELKKKTLSSVKSLGKKEL